MAEHEQCGERYGALAAKARLLPSRPGVYLFKDARGRVIYVGKAKNLRARLRSYLAAADSRYNVRFLMERAVDLETLVTASETEALILENNLIKQYKPRYNIRLKDDKSYLSVKVTTRDRWPRVLVTRRIIRDGNSYLGPYASATGLRETIETMRRVFPLRSCSDAVFRNRSRPCLEYQIKRCMAPCVLDVNHGEYERHLRSAIRLLEGDTDGLVADLTAQMREAAAGQLYEEAARVRDRIAAVRTVAEKQKVVSHGGGDRDIFGLYREGGFIEAQVLLVRAGKLVGNHAYRFEDYELPDDEVLSSLLARFYQGERLIPDEILLPFEAEGAAALVAYLARVRGRRVVAVVPRRGTRRRLVEMATENAAHSFRERSDEAARVEKMLTELQKRLRLASVPKRIECVDISHVQGEAVVASVVAFDEGAADKSGYRRYRLRGVQRNDDFAAMKEVLQRRLLRGKREGGLPDLLLLDGGRGQLAIAVEVVKELGVADLELCALAKDHVVPDASSSRVLHTEERVFRPGRSNPVPLHRNSNALFLLQRIRDEAHRFAISFHREVRAKRRLHSALDDVAGIGPARRKALLSRFGSLRRIREATPDELAAVPGVSPALAARVLDTLQRPAGQ